MTDPTGYSEFERLLPEHPDEAWNLAYQAGRDALAVSMKITDPADLTFASDVLRALTERLAALRIGNEVA